MVSTVGFAVSALVLLSVSASTAVPREIPEAMGKGVVGTGAGVRLAWTQSALGVSVSAAAQNAEDVEAALSLDRPTRRLIQQGLRNEGFDPGAADGLFGPRTRAAIRRWQEVRGVPPTGYLNGPQAELLRERRTPVSPDASSVVVTPTTVESPVVQGDTPRARNDEDPPRPARTTGTTDRDNQDPPATPVALAPDPGTGREVAARAVQGRSTISTTPATGIVQLPPAIQVDRLLVRAERLLAEENHGAAHRVMRDIIALRDQHDLALDNEFHFRYAEVAFAAGRTEAAIASLNDYLVSAGRDGELYREALELLDSAEEDLRRAQAERRRAEAERQLREAERRRVEVQRREGDELARRQIAAAARALPRDRLRSGRLGPEMVTIASGRFLYWAEQWRGPDFHPVEFDRPFAISRYEVTRGEFERFVETSRYRTASDDDERCLGLLPGRQPPRWSTWKRPFREFRQSDDHPVVCVGVSDAMAYAEWLSQQTGNRYRLPSIAEWQYAARAGSPEALYSADVDYSGLLDLGRHCGRANLSEEGSRTGDCGPDGVRYTAPVGRFPANSVGLHDMIGNVSEWVLACLHAEPGSHDWRLTADGAAGNTNGCQRSYSTAMGHDWLDGGRDTFFGSQTYGGRPAGGWEVGFRVVRDLSSRQASQ